MQTDTDTTDDGPRCADCDHAAVHLGAYDLCGECSLERAYEARRWTSQPVRGLRLADPRD